MKTIDEILDDLYPTITDEKHNGLYARDKVKLISQEFADQFCQHSVTSRLKFKLEVNAGRLAEPLLKEGKHPIEDENCHKAFLMLAHLQEIEDYLNEL